MKTLAIISGSLSLSIIPIGVMFKIMHWQGAGVILLIGIGLFSLVFIPSLAVYLFKKSK